MRAYEKPELLTEEEIKEYRKKGEFTCNVCLLALLLSPIAFSINIFSGLIMAVTSALCAIYTAHLYMPFVEEWENRLELRYEDSMRKKYARKK